MLSGVTWLNV
jgi:hypothetical protein